jgi:hypothetical protein
MSPIVHGRMYPELENWGLLNYVLRILLDPQTVQGRERALLDIDTLRRYLRDIKSPCDIALLLPAQTPGQMDDAYRFMGRLGADVLSSASIVVPAASDAFPPDASLPPEALALASTAIVGEADVVVSEELTRHPEVVKRFKDLNLSLVGMEEATRSCETFVRGHEIPWSFARPVWGMPWNTFYVTSDPDIRMTEQLRTLAGQKGVPDSVQEQIRRLGLNRWAAIMYTRDKLLFYLIQRRAAKRRRLSHQNFTFELSYHLTTYFLLFWGALDQVSWIVNEACGLGFTPNQWREVGVSKKKFLERLAARDPEMFGEFQEAEFLRWLDVLKRARHWVAHQGIAGLSPLYEQPQHEPSDAEVDRAVALWPEWQELERTMPPDIVEWSKSLFRMRWREQNYKRVSDAAFAMPGATDTAIIFPLDNIEWEYERFRAFLLAVARRCAARLEARPDVTGA